MNKRQITFFIGLLAATHSYAQQHVIQGTVKDKDSKQQLEEVNIRYQRGIVIPHRMVLFPYSRGHFRTPYC